VMLNEAKTSRPRPMPELRGRGQFLEAEAKAEAKNNYKKYQIMTNDDRINKTMIKTTQCKFFFCLGLSQ